MMEPSWVEKLLAEPLGMIKSLPDDVVWDSDIVDVPPERKVLAKTDLLQFVDTVMSGFPDSSFNLVQNSLRMTADGERMVFEVNFEGTNTEWYPNVGVTNQHVSLKGAVIADLKENRITRLATHWNCARAMAQLGVRTHIRPDPMPYKPQAS